MRKTIQMFVLFLVATLPMFAQLKVTVNLSSRPDPYLSSWSTRKEVVIVTIINSGTNPVRAKFDCKINQNGQLVANTKPEKMRMLDVPTGVSQYYGEDLVPFENVKIKDGLDRTAVQTGMLPAGSYEFCCALLDQTDREISIPVCKNFTLQSYQAPVLLQPEDKGGIKKNERPMFRWTPVSPRPSFPISYQLRVFEVLQGQTPINAFRVNKPILERSDIPVTQFQWPSDFDLPNPKLQHVWTVRAIDDKGNSVGEPLGYATPFTFADCCYYPIGCCPPDDFTDTDNGGTNAKVKGKDSTKKDRDFKPMGQHIPDAQLRTKGVPDSLVDYESGSENNDLSASKEKGKDSTKKDRDFKPMGQHIPDAQLRTKNTDEEDSVQLKAKGNHIRDTYPIKPNKKSSVVNDATNPDGTNVNEEDSVQLKAKGEHIKDAFGKKPNKKGYDAYVASAKKGYEYYQARAKRGYDYYQAKAKKGYDAYAAKGKKGYDAYIASAKKEYEEYTTKAKKDFDEYLAYAKKGYQYYMSKYSEDDHALSKKSFDMYNALAMDKFEEYSKQSKKSFDMYNALAMDK